MTIEEAILYLTPIAENASLERYKEALGLALSALREKEERRWIPVTERLPDQGDRVLCVVKSFAFPGRKYYNILRYDKYGFNENGIYTDDVTHWMPMPEPPKEGANNG